ncbi:MAG: restriction endonuclease subunit S [Malacoplasma sp.]|nr:restriction endonuclease subunit S [Malacoplasma sp.]
MNNKIDTSNWKEFKLGNIFKIEKSKNIVNEVAEESKGNDLPYITRTEFNNGVKFFVNSEDFLKKEKGNCITIGGEGANVYYQSTNFISGNNINKLYSDKLNENTALFIVSIINLEKYRYSYNRAFNKKCIENTIIKLPVDNEGNPDWKYMENYIKSLREREREIDELSQSFLEKNTLDFDTKNWKIFSVDYIFKVSGSKTTPAIDLEISDNSNFFYITTKNQNNGVESKNDFFTERGNCITIDSATIGACFYQEKNFVASDHVEIIRNINLNKYHYLFIVTLLSKEKYRYGYGRKWNQKNIKKTKIYLPVSKNGHPDWDFMENYIKTLPYSKYI